MEDILQKVEKTTDRELFGMQRYARYSAYQALLEISPKGSFPIEGCMAKAVIYILQWIKAKLSGNDEIDRDKEFEALPTANDWEKLGKLEESPWSDKKFKEPIKLKLKYCL